MTATMTAPAALPAGWATLDVGPGKWGQPRTAVYDAAGDAVGLVVRYGGDGHGFWEAHGCVIGDGLAATAGFSRHDTLDAALAWLAAWPGEPESRPDYAGRCEFCTAALFDGGAWDRQTANDDDGEFAVLVCGGCAEA